VGWDSPNGAKRYNFGIAVRPSLTPIRAAAILCRRFGIGGEAMSISRLVATPITGDLLPSSKLKTEVDSYVETIKTTKKGK